MIEKIIEWSSKNKFFIFLGVFFLIAWGLWAMLHTPLDAIPDLSDRQVIVFSQWPGRDPQLVEDQVTYPIVTSLINAPHVKVVRGYSFFGLSFVYVIFDDQTDLYWDRSRVVEYMQGVQGNLPDGVTPALGPDATGPASTSLTARFADSGMLERRTALRYRASRPCCIMPAGCRSMASGRDAMHGRAPGHRQTLRAASRQ